MMKTSSKLSIALLFFLMVVVLESRVEAQSILTCRNRPSPCFRRQIRCPKQCPDAKPLNPKAKACFLDCNSPKCETTCKGRKPKCNGVGSGCYDPRFIGGDGVVFFFHGKKNEHFSLITDHNLQINARFIGLRPSGRARDFTWIQALGIMFNSHALTVQATKSEVWNDDIDHLSFTYNSQLLEIPEGHLSTWNSSDTKLVVERTGSRNSATVTIEGIAEISINVVPVTQKDSEIHGYNIPSDNCFAHLEVQFQFFGLSTEVDGILGRTYRPGFENTAKQGVAMPVVGGEDKYQTSSLLSADCNYCIFSPAAAN